MTSTPTSSANIDVDAIDAMVGSPVVVGGKLTLTAETNPNTVPADKNLQAIATDTQGAGTATAKVKQTAAIFDSEVQAGAAVQLIATETLGLSADATTTSDKAKAIATLGTTPRAGENYTNGGILGSDITSNGEFYVNSLVNNATTATASSTSNNTGGIAAKAKATLSDSFGIVGSNIKVGGGSDVNVQNNDVLTSSASTTSDKAKAIARRGEVTGIRFNEGQKFKSSGSADIDVAVGTNGKIGDSAENPNIVQAISNVDGSGDARAKLISGSNYGVTGGFTRQDPPVTEVVEGDGVATQNPDSPLGGATRNSTVITLNSPYNGQTLTLKGLGVGDSSPDTAKYKVKLFDVNNNQIGSTKTVSIEDLDSGGQGIDVVFDLSTFTNPQAETITVVGKKKNGTETGLVAKGGLGFNELLGDEVTPEPFTVQGATIKINGDGTINAEVANTFTTTAETTHGSSTATSKISSSDVTEETIGIDLALAKIKGTGIINGAVDNTQVTDATTTTGASTASSEAGLTKGIRATTINIKNDATIVGAVHSEVTTSASTHGGGDAIASADAVNPKNVGVKGKNFSTFGGETVGADLDKVVSKSDLDLKGTVLSTYDVDAINTHGNADASSASLQVTGVLSSIAKGVDVDIDGSATVNQNVKAKTVGGGNAKAIITSGPDFPRRAPGPILDGITGVASTSKINAKGTLNVDGIVDYDGTAVAENTTGNAKAKVGTNHEPLQAMVATLLVDSDGVKSGSDMHISGQSTADTIAKATTHSGKASASVDSGPVKGIKSNAGVLYKAKGDLTLDGQATFTADVDSRSTGTNAYAENSSASADLANTLGVDLSNLDSRQTTNPNQLKAKGAIDVDGTVSTTLNSKALNTTGQSTASTTTSLQKGILISDNAAGGPPTSSQDSYGYEPQTPSTVVKGNSVDLDGQVTSASTAKAVTHGGGDAIASADAVNPKNVGVKGKNFSTFGGETVGADLDKVVSKSDLDLKGTVLSTYDVDAINTHGNADASSASLQVTGVLSSIAKGVDVDIDGSATVNQNVKAKTVGGGNAKAIITSGPDFPRRAPGPILDGITGVASTSKINAKGTLNVDGIVDYDGTAVAENTTGNAKAKVGTNHEPLQAMVATLLVDSDGVKSGSDMHISGQSTADTIAKATTHSGKASASVDSGPVKGIKSNAGVLYKAKGDLTLDGQATFTADVDSRSTGTNAYAENSSASADLANTLGVDLSNLDSRQTTNPNQLKAKGAIDVDGTVSTTLNSKALNTTGQSTASTTTSLQKGILISDNAAGGPPTSSQDSYGYEPQTPSTVVKGNSVDLDGQVTSASTAKAVTHGGGDAIASADAVNPKNVGVKGKNFSTFGGETVGADLDKVVSKSDLDLKGTVLSTYDVDAINTHGNADASSASLQVTGVLSSIAKGVDVDIDGSATVNQNVKAKTVGGGNAKAIITSGPDFPRRAPGPILDGITGVASTSKINAKGTLNVDGIVDYDGTAVAENTTGNAKAKVGTNHEPLQAMVATLLVDSDGVKSGSDMHISGQSTADTIAKATTHSGKASASVDSGPVKGIKSNAGVLYKAKGDLTLDGQATFTADVDSRSTGTNAYAENSSASADLANTLGVDLSNLDSRQTTNPNQLKAKGAIDVDGTVSTTLNSKALNTTGQSTASTTTSLQKGILISDNAAGGPPTSSQDSYGYEPQTPSTVVKGNSVDLDGQVTSASTAKAVTHGGGDAIASADAVNPKNVGVKGKNFSTFGGETVGADLDKVVSKSDLDLKGTVLSTYDVDAINTHGNADASSASLQVTGVLSSIAKGVDVDIDGSATVNQNVKAKTVGGGNAKAIITSGPDFPRRAPGPILDGITGVASTSKINAKGTLNVDGIVDYDGTAVAENTTGNAKAKVGTNHEPLQAMVATLLVDSDGVKSGSDMHISGTAEVDTISAATTTTGSATASIVSDPVKGIKTIPGVKLQSNGELIIDGLAQIGAQSTATVVGTGQRAKAKSNVDNVIGVDMSDLNSVTTSGPIKASAKGDLTFQGIASANLNSTANITTGNAKSKSTNSLVVGIIAEKIKSNGDGGILGGAYNTSNASATSVGEHGGYNRAKAIVNNSDTVGINLDKIISINGTGSVVGEGIANGYSQAYGTTAATTAKAEMNAKGILLDNGSDIEIKGSGKTLGNVTGSGYVGTLYYNDAGYITLSPFNTEAITTTGNSTSKATFTALGITTDNGMSDSTIKIVNGDITGTGAAVIDTTSETKNGQSTAKSTTDIFGIKATNLDIGGSGNTITGYAYGNINTEALNTNGDANATSTIKNGIGIDGGSSGINANVIGEIIGIADITHTVTAKTVSGNATATATSGPVIGIKNTSIYSAGDLTITANASLNSTAYSESISGM